MHYVRNTLGIALLLCLWGVAALFVAPAMEQRLQADAEQLLAGLDSGISAEARGLAVTVSGAVDTAEERYAALAQLKRLHPLVTVRPDVKILSKPRFERKLPPGAINLNELKGAVGAPGDAASPAPGKAKTNTMESPPEFELHAGGREAVFDIGLGDCGDMQLLDPSLPCGQSNE